MAGWLLCAPLCASVVESDSCLAKQDSLVCAAQLADSIEAYARGYLGAHYHYGGSSPEGFDCSGFTMYVYKHFGIELPHTSAGQFPQGRALSKDFRTLQKGDLVFFAGRKNSSTIGHVGIFLALDDSLGKSFSFIHGAHTGVIISHYSEPYYRERYKSACRVIPSFSVFEDTPILDGALLVDTISQPVMTELIKEETVMEDTQVEVVYHTIQSGDTLYALSRKYGCTVKQLCELNNISENKVLRIGERLRVN